MQKICYYISPIGKMLLAADEEGLTGAWFENQKHFGRMLKGDEIEKDTFFLTQARRWLDDYFAGNVPIYSLPFHLIGTEFQKEVWAMICAIPYGQTMTYGAIAEQIAVQRGACQISAQAVGGAVGRNPLSIFVPCHRVVGKNGDLTGYAGGIQRKIQLLEWENINKTRFYKKEI